MRAAATAEAARKKEDLRLSWYSNNATQEGLHKVITTMEAPAQSRKVECAKDMESWNDMASFFRGLN